MVSSSCSHGDMLYLEAVMSPVVSSTNMAANVMLDEVDNILLDKDGKIYRKMNPQLLVFTMLDVVAIGYQVSSWTSGKMSQLRTIRGVVAMVTGLVTVLLCSHGTRNTLTAGTRP